MKPSVLILHASGTNRDEETVRACEMAGARAEVVHINRMRAGERRLADYDMLILPGGFSYGDALGAGVRWALDLRVYLQDELLDFAGRGRLILGICNGFQALVKSGLLPGALGDEKEGEPAREKPIEREVTLTDNAQGRFECRWVYLMPNAGAAAPVVSAIEEPIFCPVAHGEGRFRAGADTLVRLRAGGCIAFQYATASGELAEGAYPLNPNGSVADIAGICNPAGNIIGLMPHPEDHIEAVQIPSRRGGGLGLQLFKAMVESVQ